VALEDSRVKERRGKPISLVRLKNHLKPLFFFSIAIFGLLYNDFSIFNFA